MIDMAKDLAKVGAQDRSVASSYDVLGLLLNADDNEDEEDETLEPVYISGDKSTDEVNNTVLLETVTAFFKEFQVTRPEILQYVGHEMTPLQLKAIEKALG